MREITRHKVNGVNEALTVNAVDDHHYLISGYSCEVHFAHGQSAHENSVDLRFQNGVDGVNGITNEALIAILIDRLEGFQRGPFKCEENKLALVHLLVALDYLKVRTERRLKRGVEGTYNV